MKTVAMPSFVSSDSSGHLVAGAPSGRRPLTAMRFLPVGLAVSAPPCAEVVLPWDLFDHLHSTTDGGPPQDRLAVDMEGGMLSAPSYPDGLGRDATDIHVAIRQAGLAHLYGRPLTKNAALVDA
jgi:hypothetical protein